jgi:hypothetical protein
MASTFSTSLRLELIGNGDQSGTWGTTTNTNLGTLLEQAITGVVAITMTNADKTLTNTNGTSDEARNAVLVVGGTNSGIKSVIAPAVNKTYIVVNNTIGGYAIIIRTSSSTGVSIPNGATQTVYCDGTEFYLASFPITGGTITGNLAVNGTLNVTGATTLATTSVAATTITNTLTANSSVGAAGQLLTSRGAALSPEWTTLTAFVSGMIMMWSGSIGTIPSGWLICDGTNSTPDLRNRFVVGAGSTYAVNAIGGNADSIVISHSHTFAGDALAPHSHSYNTKSITQPQTGSSTQCWVGDATGTTSAVSGGTPSGTISTTGSTGINANLPPYLALAYIMKA